MLGIAEARKKIGFNYNKLLSYKGQAHNLPGQAKSKDNIGFRLAIKLEANIQTLLRVLSSSVLLLRGKDRFLSIQPSNCLVI